MTDDYSKYPESLGERYGTAAKAWTPREALINTLRAVDSGEFAPTAIVICVAFTDKDGTEHSTFRAASPSGLVTLGLLELIKQRVIDR